MESAFERWSPVTHDFGLIKAPLTEVVEAFLVWQQAIGTEFASRVISKSFADALLALPPLSVNKRRRLFVPTASEWTAYFQSGIQGSDPSPAMTVLSQRLGTSAMRVCVAPAGARYPATIWEVYAPLPEGAPPEQAYRRTLAAANDGGKWTFDASGEPFDFERTAEYSARRVRDRFTPAMLAEYLVHFGIGPLADEFFPVTSETPAVCVEQQNRHWSAREFTLEEVRAGVPWQR